VVSRYADQGILVLVDGIGPIDEVTDRVMDAVRAATSA
jgi:adenylate kinase